jgi:hypothetical protein
MDEKIIQLERLGFIHKKIGMGNEKYFITYDQMDKCRKDDWLNFINAIKLSNNGRD